MTVASEGKVAEGPYLKPENESCQKKSVGLVGIHLKSEGVLIALVE